jgi:TonB family protein
MHDSGKFNRQRFLLNTNIFIVVVAAHLVIIDLVWKPNFNKSIPFENIQSLESFTIQSENAPPEKRLDEERYKPDAPKEITQTHQAKAEVPHPDKKRQILKRNTFSQINPESFTLPTIDVSDQFNHAPPYPKKSQRRGEQGKVVIAVEVSANGEAAQAILITSSGYPRLDKAALETVLKWRFIAGKKAGVPQKMWVNIPINFVLE